MTRIHAWLLPLCLLLLPLPQAMAWSRFDEVRDSLGRLYVSATAAGQHLIVDQGRYKAIFNAEGRPLTPFSYKDLRPGLDGLFLARIQHAVLLIDSSGTERAAITGIIDKIDTVHRFYRSREYNAMHFYRADGSLTASIPLSYGTDPRGPYVWGPEYSAQQGVIDSLVRVLLPQVYRSVQIGEAGITAMKGDSAYAFDRAGRLRFRTVAHESKLLYGGAVGIKLYGLWSVFDSTGRLRIPFTSYHIEARPGEAFFELNERLMRLDGTELTSGRVSYVEKAPGGWYGLHYQSGSGEELRDDAFSIVLPRGSYGKLEYAGERFIFVFADYNDRTPRIYDRKIRAFTKLLVEKHIYGDAYLLYNSASGSRQILKGDAVLPLPRFTELERVRGHPYFRISHQDSGALGYRERRERSQGLRVQQALIRMRRASQYHYGLLDTAMRLIVPLQHSDIRVLPSGLIHAEGSDKEPGTLYKPTGAVLMRVTAGSGLSMSQDLIRIGGPAGVILADTLGRVIYRGGESPALLVPDPQATPERNEEPVFTAEDEDPYEHPRFRDILQEPLLPTAPVLLLYDDSSGYSGLYDREGQQLLPHRYYPVAQRVRGLHSLKNGDSIYFVNAHGRLLYGGRGFSGRSCHVLENYSVLLRDSSGLWGSIDAQGRSGLPFVYDSVYAAAPHEGPTQYTLVQQGRYTVLDHHGRLRYPPQPWQPWEWVAADHIIATDRQHYRVIGGQAVPVPADSVWGVTARSQHHQHGHFRVKTDPSGLRGNIYSRGGRLLAPWYRGFSYQDNGGRMLITNEARSQIAVIDTVGTVEVPFTNNLAALILADSAVLLVDTGKRDMLYYTDGRGLRRTTVQIDSATRAHLLANRHGDAMSTSTAALLRFRTAAGHWGVMNYSGRVLIDRSIREIRSGDYVWRVRTTGGWGLFEPRELRYLQSPDADSISQEREGAYFRIWKAGRAGLYDPQSRIYFPPVYTAIYQPQTLGNGYLVTRVPEGYAILNSKGERIAPLLDSVNTNAPTIPSMAAFMSGEEVSLAIGTDGRIVVERGLDAKIRRQGFDGSFGPVVILRAGSKFGLYSNEQFRMIAPLHYDAIDASDYGFVIWKYKPDKHQGMDSTLLLDRKGRVIRAMRGGFDPVHDDGFWYLRGHGNSPVLNAAGVEIIPDGYRVNHVERSRHFLVGKDKKHGIVSDTGSWVTPLIFDKILPDQAYSPEARVGQIGNTGRMRLALINRLGVQVTAPVYDDIRFDDTQILFRRGTLKGFLDEQGREVLRPVPKEAFNDD